MQHHASWLGDEPLYTEEQRRRRDSTWWTTVQGVLAPTQFIVFLVSLALVIWYLTTGEGLELAAWSIVIKTLILYTIMVTGAIWEKVVFGKYLFAPAFFWEDAVSMLVILLHTAYLVVWFGDIFTPVQQMMVALAAYILYVINAFQFLLKLRAARLQEQRTRDAAQAEAAAGGEGGGASKSKEGAA
ncbi:2-vinyl bacteriochlorophyllide hydratase [Halorhodospira halochloris]|uniref:2-vinyl bacteriochlorophyllide hydratase n=1 Tax=Halorhodospira halochloris TaxID=1052 RepID=UPI001EE89A85|nr:2-vinyl bacteriochlorophyllide hydratase [Halorhodospira halochloris]MCG5530203.1 2-vinyl bacteriochlorophyllide hydratase [Halorhodospira halochloris]MCG5548061.1 2-vinyl bacteriochlorophyllide hydratase [Halorhodospira halochloris]